MEVRLINANDIVKVAERAYNAWNLAMATQDTNRGINKVFKMQELCKAVEAVAKDAPTIDPEDLPLVKELREQLAKVTAQKDAAVARIRQDHWCEDCKHKKAMSSCTNDALCDVCDNPCYCKNCNDGSLWEFNDTEQNDIQNPLNQLRAFLESETDSYAILHLRCTPKTIDDRFMSYDRLKQKNKEPNIVYYDVVYVSQLGGNGASRDSTLGALCAKFNLTSPEGYCGRGLSISDIVALKIDGVVSYHYVDPFGFKELTDFGPNK